MHVFVSITIVATMPLPVWLLLVKIAIVGISFFSSNDAVSAGQRGRLRDRERSVLRVRMTLRVEELGLLRPGVAPMY